MQTIETRYYTTPNGNVRILAKASGGYSKCFDIDYSLSHTENHMKAALTLKNELDWPGKMHGGHTANGMVFVWDNDYTIE